MTAEADPELKWSVRGDYEFTKKNEVAFIYWL